MTAINSLKALFETAKEFSKQKDSALVFKICIMDSVLVDLHEYLQHYAIEDITMSDTIEMDYELWLEQFRPQLNHIDANASIGEGLLYEIVDSELDYVQLVHQKYPDRVWTVIEDHDTNDWFICPGFHYVNRIGYIITEIAAPKNTHISVKYQ